MKNSYLFRIINKTIEKKGVAPFEILDYGIAESISTNRDVVGVYFSPVFSTMYGASEGIYTTCYVEGDFLGEHKRIMLGTYKTLNETKDDFRKMCQIGSEFSLALIDFVNSHMALFEQNVSLKNSDIEKLIEDFSVSYNPYH